MKLPGFRIGLIKKRNGKIISARHEPGHSWTRNAWNWFFCNMAFSVCDNSGKFGAGYMSFRRTDGTIDSGNTLFPSRVARTSVYGFMSNVSNNVSHYGGIHVGAGDKDFNVNDHALDSLISGGTGAGQLNFPSMMNFWRGTYADNSWTATLEREFTNNSGGDVTVKEVGLVYKLRLVANKEYLYLFARDVLNEAVTIASGESLVVQYEITMDFSDIGKSAWTRNIWNRMFSAMTDTQADFVNDFTNGILTAKTIGGAVRRTASSVPFDSHTIGVDLRAGAGDTAYNVNDFKLESMIADGSGAGQLTHGSAAFPALNYSGKKWIATLSRDFTNNSGNPITIKETGITKYNIQMYSSYWDTFLHSRNVLSSPVVVGNGETFTLQYAIEMDFSGID